MSRADSRPGDHTRLAQRFQGSPLLIRSLMTRSRFICSNQLTFERPRSSQINTMIGLHRVSVARTRKGTAVEWALIVLFIIAAIVGVWLWDRLVDGATNVLVRAVVWPFEKLFGVAKKSDALRTFRAAQHFQLAATPERVREVLGALREVATDPLDGRIAPYYVERQPQCIRIGVGNGTITPYELAIEFTAGWPGTCGELRYLRWPEDPSDDMGIHRMLLENIFGSLGTLDSMLYVTTDPITIDTETPPPDPATREQPTSRPPLRPGAGAPILPVVGPVAAASAVRRLPAIPAIAVGLFVMALVVGSCSAMGFFSPTSTPELCSAYSEAKGGFSYGASDNVVDFMDKQNLGEEISELEDRASSYDDDGVKDDAGEIGDLGETVSESEFDSATTHIASVC